jgi:nucleoside-diphosphate-sugar epimerase
MRVVVTGATGNLGSALVPRLLREPRVTSVVGIARRVPTAPATAGVEWVRADVATDELETVFRGADAVVHLAWAIQPSRRPTTLWATNVVGTRRVVDAVVRAGVPALVHASSVGVYSPGPKDRRVDETWPSDGVATLGYSWQKAYVERELDLLEREHPTVRVVRIRPGLIMQRSAAHSMRLQFLGPLVPTSLVPVQAALGLIRNVPVPFQVVHADDVAAAYVAATVREVRGPFNVAAEPVVGRPGPGARPLLETARVAADLLWRLRLMRGDPAWIDQLGVAPLLDCSRAERLLDWSARVDALAAIGEVLEGWHAEGTAPTPALTEGPLMVARGPELPGSPTP